MVHESPTEDRVRREFEATPPNGGNQAGSGRLDKLYHVIDRATVAAMTVRPLRLQTQLLLHDSQVNLGHSSRQGHAG